MKWILLFLLTLLLTGSTFVLNAQSSEVEEDVLYLKNGSVIRGEIVERQIGVSVKVEVLGGSVFAFPESEVETILRAPKVWMPPAVNTYSYSSYSSKSWRKERPVSAREKGFYNLFSFGFQPATDLWGDFVPWPTLQYRTGYHFSQYLNLGIGTGVDAYSAGGTVPFFVDFHGELGKVKRLMPHYYAHAGYGAGAWSNWAFADFKGGPMAHLGIGWKINTRSHAEWLFTLGYKFQSVSYITEEDPWSGQPVNTGVTKENYNRLVLQFAFGF